MAIEEPPNGLGEAGQNLWRSIVDVYELGPGELRLLEDACAEADLIAAMTEAWEELGRPMTALGSMKQVIAHPMLQELRQHRNALRQLIVSMKLPVDDESEELGSVITSNGPMSRSDSARIAARARWDRRRNG